MRADARSPHEKLDDHSASPVPQIGHDVVLNVPVVAGVASRGEGDGGRDREEKVRGAHSQYALGGDAERLRLLRRHDLLVVGEEAEVVAQGVGRHAQVRKEGFGPTTPEQLGIEVDGVGRQTVDHDHHIGEEEGENAKPRDEEELLRVADAAQDITQQCTDDVQEQVAGCLVPQEALWPGQTLDKIEHADHGAQQHTPDSHVKEH